MESCLCLRPRVQIYNCTTNVVSRQAINMNVGVMSFACGSKWGPTATARSSCSCTLQPVERISTELLTLPRTITIPPLACSQPLRMHPCYDSIREQADAWLVSAAKPRSGEEAEKLVQSLFPFITCTTHVDLEESLCLVAAKFMAWAFAYDDITDDAQEGLGGTLPAAEKFLKDVHRALAQPPMNGSGLAAHADAPERYRAAANIDVGLAWWNELRNHLSPAYQARFCYTLRLFTTGAATQIGWRQASLIPDLYTYIAERRCTAGLYPFHTLLESGLGVEFDESILDCPLLTQLRRTATDHVAWVNDLISFKREYVQTGDFCNILAVIWQQPSSPGYGNLQRSVDIVCEMIKQRDQDFATLVAEAHDCRALMEKPGVAKYIQGLADWLSGNLHWSYATARTHVDDRDRQGPRLVDAPLTIHLW
ncbi:hypothetical protein L7F22_012905 [Adiantum nelumboides]|nr:hypothetical protein [Adiantum nelumboides]MCO5559309.1 hypothetical protein [Adiantum nelumboides]